MTDFAIITVSFNSSRTVEATLASVARQTNVSFVHIVQDGGSHDGTADVVGRFQQVQFVSEPDAGIYDGLNKAVARAPDAIIGLLHADDFYPDDTVLQRVRDAFAQNPDLLGVYGDLVYVSNRDTSRIVRKWRSRPFQRRLLGRGWMPPHPALFLKRSVYDDVGTFDLQYQIAADYDFILRVFEKYGDRIAYLPSVLVYMRTGGISNSNLRNIFLKMYEDLKIASRFGIWAPFVLLSKNLSKLVQFRR